jgi:multimeric flavodoxin WrbA
MAEREILIVVGSPRPQGACAALADEVRKGAEAAGAVTHRYDLHGMDMQPCTACDACLESADADCIVEDDMRLLYPLLRRVDALVIASPVYWFNVSAQTKLFIDRGFYALQDPEGGNALKGKEVGLILAYGAEDLESSGGQNAISSFEDIFGFIGVDIVGTVHGSTADGDIRLQNAVMKEAYKLGQRLGGGH